VRGAALEVERLSCGYREQPVLHDITLEITGGELVGVIGPNGSGKTTLLRAITRILKPQKGEVLINSQDIWQIPRREIARQIAVVSQSGDPILMSVYDYILLGRFPYHRAFQFFESQNDENIARKYMEMTDTVALKDSLMNEISGGERQLAQIARALVQEPLVLMLDEPTAHLDIAHQVRILDLIKRLNTTLGLTVVMVLHDLNLASEYCSRLVLLNKGLVHKTGTPDEVLTYKVIEDVYETTVVVERNPLSDKPFVLLVTEDEMQRQTSGGNRP
jgi:iron complex transport system ATP-binding protein